MGAVVGAIVQRIVSSNHRSVQHASASFDAAAAGPAAGPAACAGTGADAGCIAARAVRASSGGTEMGNQRTSRCSAAKPPRGSSSSKVHPRIGRSARAAHRGSSTQALGGSGGPSAAPRSAVFSQKANAHAASEQTTCANRLWHALKPMPMKPTAFLPTLVDMPTDARPFTSSGEKPCPSCEKRRPAAAGPLPPLLPPPPPGSMVTSTSRAPSSTAFCSSSKR